MRIGAMVRQPSRRSVTPPSTRPAGPDAGHLRHLGARALRQPLAHLAQELSRVAQPFVGEEIPSEAELRVAQAQLVGWLEGLFHGIQATLFAQQMTARNQLEEMRRRALPGRPGPGPGSDAEGQYL